MSIASPEIVIFDAELMEERDYWVRNLSRGIGASYLKLDYERPKGNSTDSESVEVELPGAVQQNLKKLTGGSPFLLYTALLTALKVCLHKYSGSDCIAVGSPLLSNGNGSQPRGNLLTTVDDIDEQESFQQFLLRVRETLLDANKRQRYPFQRLIKDLRLENIENRCPLFDIALVLEGLHKEMPEVGNDVTITFTERAEGLSGQIKFRSGLFNRETIERFRDHFINVLRAGLEDIRAPIYRIEMLAEAERQQLLVEWSGTRTEYPTDKTLHQLFEQQVGRTPHHIALSFDGEELTYQQLNERANRLAHRLRREGVGPEVLVGLCLERSLEMVEAVLAVHKAGGAYVPLDPHYPQERLRFMIEDASLKLVVTQSRLAELLPEEAAVLLLDREWQEGGEESSEPVESGVRSENLAYVIYTSGSTGQPKGVLVTHANVVRLFAATQASYGFGAQDVWTLFHSYAFDFSVWEIWGALLYGGRLVVVPYMVSRTPEAFYELLVEEGVTVLNQTPSAFRQLMKVEEERGGAGLVVRVVIFGGEALEVRSLQGWFERHTDEKPEMVNMYGITETTVHVTYLRLLKEDCRSREGSPIGRPIADLDVYVLDRHMQPVAVGAPGELYVGGDGLARGYMNRAELTAQRFVPHPFSRRGGERLYRTGDVVSYRPDGQMLFIGRADNQVKIRGFRIELGEIEALLLQHAGVKEAVVVMREDSPDDKRLVAYVVADQVPVLEVSRLRGMLRERLPEYMVPQAFVFMEKMPLMSNGKVDRRALPPPEIDISTTEGSFVAPRTPIEEALTGIFAEVLGVQRVGREDNFFELGGHSLLATQVISRLQQTFHVEIVLRSLFERPTVAGIAGVIEDLLRKGEYVEAPPIERVSREGELPLSFAQQRLWFLDQLEPSSVAYNASSALRLHGPLLLSALSLSFDEIIRRHEVLRTGFSVVDGQPVQLIKAPSGLPVALTDLSWMEQEEREEEVRRLASEEAQRPFDLSSGPLVRATLVRLTEEEHVLLWTMHHIISDGWSMGILIKEVAALYQAFSEGRPSPLAELEIQYADFAAWQREWLQGEALEAQLSYWKEQLKGAPAVLELPTDRARPPVQSFRGAHQSLSLSPTITEGLKALSQREGVTLFMTLLAAFQSLLSRYSHQLDIVVGSPIAGRTRPQTEPLIGFFANILALRSDLSGNPSFTQLLSRVREVCLGAYAHQDLPFEKLVEELQPERDLSHSPLFQVALALDNTSQQAVELPALRLSVIGGQSHAAKFDLTLSLTNSRAGLVGAVEYNTDLFEAETMSRFVSHFENLLCSVIASPEQPLSQIELLSERERHQLLVEWNQTSAEYPQELCLHQLFEQQVERTPDNVAVIFEGEQLSYRQLNERANRLAHRLMREGVGPEVLVGLCLERSLEMVEAVLAVHKAGGAYVPLDPHYPQERLRFMIEDASLKLVVTQSQLAELLPEEVAMVLLDREWQEGGEESYGRVESGVRSENLAYVIYTSGSTGLPKGAMLSHRGIINCLSFMQSSYQLSSSDSFLFKTSLNFDPSVWELFWPLFVGARIIVAPPRSQSDPQALLRSLIHHRVSSLYLVPSMLSLFLDQPQVSEAAHSLRRLICGGEALSLQTLERFFALLPGVELRHSYGPTEVSIAASEWRCQIAGEGERGRVLMGQPLTNVQTYVLDEELEPVPVGVRGELYLGGEGVGRGYVRRPEQTAERFVPDPFSSEPGRRMYRTGDLVRWHSDAQLEFLGRLDHQVKLRGFRIELQEIEAVLSQHPAIREAVVLAREDSPGDKRLVAYLVADPEALHESDLYLLPNGLAVSHLNRNETSWLYHEIFETRSYLRHGISLRDGSTVFDVGANIGLFTLFVHDHCPQARVFAFEPSPVTFQKLERNAQLYGLDVRLYECGLSSQPGQARFTFYPHITASSGFYADAGDMEVTRQFLKNQDERMEQYAEELLEGRFQSQSYECRLRTLSEVIAEEAVQRIELLKVDAEKSELEVLRGIKEEDWEKIKQVVMEVHDIGGRVEEVEWMLRERGYEVEVEQEELLGETGLYNIYAVQRAWREQEEERRAERSEIEGGQIERKLKVEVSEVRRYVEERVPEYMVPQAFVLLEEMPRMANGKVERRALPPPERESAGSGGGREKPQTEVEEEIAEVWREVLGVERVWREDNFFELGGHSLLATQVISRLRQSYGVEIALSSIFEEPTLSALAESIERKIKEQEKEQEPPIKRVSREGELPLSFAQQRLWFLDQLEPSSVAYNASSALRLHGPLLLSALSLSFDEIIRRHEVLRTSFSVVDGQPVQLIKAPSGLPVALTDLSWMEQEEREEEVRRLASEEAQRPFDLSSGPLVRATLVRLTEEEHVLLWTMHHIISDGWSMGILIKEVAALYQAFSEGRPSPLEELPIQYADFAAWQREWLQGEVLEAQLAYWREQLAGAPPLLELPTDRARPPVQSFRGAHQSLALSKTVTDELMALSQREGVTLFMTLLAAFQSLLSRYSHQLDIVVGSPIAGRTRPQTEPLIGFFANTLALRSDLSGNPSFTQLLSRVREVCLGAYAHQDLPFEKLVEELQPERDLSHSPLFQVALALDNTSQQAVELPALRLSVIGGQSHAAKFDLTLSLTNSRAGLVGAVEYNTDLFEAETMSRFVSHFENLICSVIASPEQTLSQIGLLSEAERHQLLVEWNQTSAEYPQELCLHHLFEQQVERTPHHIALSFDGQHLTYEELNQRANRLAHRLRREGVGPEVLVGLCLERSLEMVEAVLAVHKAGGAYVPLDPHYPQERLRFMIEDASLKLVVTQAALSERLPAVDAGLLCLDTDWELIADGPVVNPVTEVNRDNLAYMIYTSGSTGQPKGVMISHRSIVNRLLWQQQTFPLEHTDRILQKTPISFDASVWELFLPLLAGAELVLARPGGHQDSHYLVETLSARAITTLQLVPSMLGVVLEEEAVRRCTSLRRVFCGGEVLSCELQERFFATLDAELINLYGPTEVSIDASFYRCTLEVDGRAVLIGRPLANTKLYVLDSEMRPTPVGVAGELYVSGKGLARGYNGRAEMTAEKFVPDPFSKEPGRRMYRTGDLVRWHSDAQLEFLGRLDHQVKLRGFRIELQEIESLLSQHPAIREAVVLAREDSPGDKRLVAYLVAEPSSLHDPDLYLLPNGLAVSHLNRNETSWLYHEIFETRSYLRHGISLPDGSTVFDVGANIGLFTLFVHDHCPQARVFAFEPSPVTFQKLEHNSRLYNLDVRLYECGLSSQPGQARFTFYPHITASSGFYADAGDMEVTRQFLKNQDERMEQYAEELLEGRFQSQSYECRLRTLSEVIAEEAVQRIELLKVDAEKSELEVLRGIKEEDWEKIKQVVMEVHDIEGRVEEVEWMLRERGYEVEVEQEELLGETGLYNIYAVQRAWREQEQEAEGEARAESVVGGQIERKLKVEVSEVRRYVEERVPEYMVPQAFVLLEEMPRMANGKVERRALPPPERERSEADVIEARTEVERQLAEVWKEVLGLKQVGREDNFFELGGHSLLATQVISRLRQSYGVEIALSSIFEEPTLSALAESIERKIKEQEKEQEPPIKRVSREGELPLSFAQQRLWFLDQLEPGSTSYSIPIAIRLKGNLNITSLEQTFNEIIRRHEVLRTTFVTAEEGAVQVIAPAQTLTLSRTDLSEFPKEQREAEARRLASEEAQRPFDLSSGPLVRATLVRLTEEEHVLLWTMHHIISDGWSMGILIKEVAALYQAFSEGRPSPLEELPIQYADFAAWQREWLQGEALEAQLSYWREQLAGAPPLLELPLDRPRPVVPTRQGAYHFFMLPGSLSEELEMLSRREDVTLFMTLLAAFQTLLWRYSGQDDIVVGTDIANRNRAETEGLIGFFVNQLALRADLGGDPSFREVLGRVRKVTLGAYAHQDLPFEKLVEAINPDRALSRTPLFQVKFILQNTPMEELVVPELKLSRMDDGLLTTEFDLTLMVWETTQGLGCRFAYNTDIFYSSTITRLAEDFETILNRVVREPDLKSSELADFLLHADMQRQLVKEKELSEARLEKFKNRKRRIVQQHFTDAH